METNIIVFILNHYLSILDDAKNELEKFLRYFVELAEEIHGDLYQLSPMQQYKIGIENAPYNMVELFKETYDCYKQNLSKLEMTLNGNSIHGIVWSRIMGDYYEIYGSFKNILELAEEES